MSNTSAGSPFDPGKPFSPGKPSKPASPCSPNGPYFYWDKNIKLLKNIKNWLKLF